MYYVMSDKGQLIERLDDRPTQAQLRELAEECACDVWVIEGEHAGIGYDRPNPKPKISARTLAMMAGLDMSVVGRLED